MVLVTGGTGILGSAILLKLLEKGYSVRATYRAQSKTTAVQEVFRYYTEDAERFYHQIEWVAVDFDDLDSLRLALVGVSQVYHCAAEVSFNPKDKRTMYHTNIEGTKNWLYIAAEMQVQKFLFVSSIAVLDQVNPEGMIDEDSAFNPKQPHSAYAVSKHFAEMEVWRASAEDLSVVVLNPGVIIGSGHWQQSSGALFGSLKKMPLSFSGCTGYVDVRDVANIAVQLMENQQVNERYIIISENKTYLEIANQVRQSLGLKPVKAIAPFWLHLGGVIHTLFGWLFPVLRWLNKANRMAVMTCTPISNKKIVETLNYTFIPVAESLDFHLKNWKKDQEA